MGGAFQLGGMGVRLFEITDGLFCTIMAGEKHVPLGTFGQGPLDQSTYNGEYPLCYTRGGGLGVSLAEFRDQPGWMFGSYHTAHCQFVMCDASVQTIFIGITPDVLERLCVRDDGQAAPDF